MHYRREGVRRPVSHLSSSQSEQLRGPVGGWRLHGRAVVCGRARDGNGCLVPAECRPPRRGDPVHGPKWFVPIRLPATNQMLQACRGRTSRISFLFRNQEGSLSVSGHGPSKPTGAEEHTRARAHGGARQRSMACVPVRILASWAESISGLVRTHAYLVQRSLIYLLLLSRSYNFFSLSIKPIFHSLSTFKSHVVFLNGNFEGGFADVAPHQRGKSK